MLTTKTIAPKQGESYYTQENYYSTDESVRRSQWFGKGAKKLGLKSKVSSRLFKKLLYGELPDGKTFRTRKEQRPGYKERAGLDCTFSAPKSVSILALVARRKELEDAHKRAVKRTLKIIERDYAIARVTIDGRVRKINTSNLVVARFHHDTSRELDPHLHTHCVILNMTNHNNRWYAFTNDEVHAHKKLLGSIYQNELAIEVKKLGYEIEQKGQGQFEIKGFEPEQLESFSKRRQQIKANLKQGLTWKEREKVWDKNRAAKGQPISRDKLRDYWQGELSNLVFPKPNLEHKRSQTKSRDITANVERAIVEAIAHCSERSVVFKPEAIESFILSEPGKYPRSVIKKAIARSNELIHLDKFVTTQTALMRELATIRIVEEGKNQVLPLSTPEAINDVLNKSSLTEGQSSAIALSATTKDRFIAWCGKAGVGKTYALNEFRKIAQIQGYVIKGFAPSAKAAKVLAEEMKIDATTVARKLVSKSSSEEPKKQIWVVDEAGLLGAKDAYNLLKKARAEDARVLLVGDTRQLSSIAAGNPFKSLLRAGITTAYLNQSLRQKARELKRAVDLISEDRIIEGIDVLDRNKCINEISDRTFRATRIASDYLSLSNDERKQTLVIAGTHAEREAILNCIRTGLKNEGVIGQDVLAKKLVSSNLSDLQKKYAHHYQEGNIVIPLVEYKRWGLIKNQQYTVKTVDKDTLLLLDSTGKEKRVSPSSFKYKEVYKVVDIKVAIGDRLRWGKNNRQLNRVNGEEFVITQIENEVATISTQKGKVEKINLNFPQHLDRALVSTTYSSQGLTSNRVLASITDDFTSSKESFYVAASRAKYNLQLYIDNRSSFEENAFLSRSQANPLELIENHKSRLSVSDSSKSINERRPFRERAEKLSVRPSIDLSQQHSFSFKVMDNYSESNYDRQKLELYISSLRERLRQLNELSRPDPKQQRRKSFLKEELINAEAFTKLSVGQRVKIDKIKGIVTDLKLSPGGMPVVWVQGDNSTVPTPERALRLTTIQNKEIQTHDPSRNSQQSTTDNGSNTERSSISRTNPHIKKIGKHRTPVASSGIQPPPSNPVRTSNRANDSVERSSNSDRKQNSAIRSDVEPNLVRDGIGRQIFDESRRSLERQQPKYQQSNQQLERVNQQLRHSSQEHERVQQQFRELANSLRDTPLIEVAEQLGLQRDRYDPHKYKSETNIISINQEKGLFYDHLNLKGGSGAIDLVMHVRQEKFRDAVTWLNGSAITPTVSSQSYKRPPKPKSKKEPFSSPKLDPSKWSAVKDYLVGNRGLPKPLVERLNSEGVVYADSQQNAVFLRKSMTGEVTGASVRGTFNGSNFKGLAKGTIRDSGWFSVTQGEGEVKRIVLTESPIDTLSAAALSQKLENTIYMSVDGAGAIPTQYLQQEIKKGTEVIVAFDNDKAGNVMAQKVLEHLPEARIIVPSNGKDWNEQLLHSEALQISQKARLILQKHGTTKEDNSVSFEGNKLIFSADSQRQNLSIYSKLRNKLIFQIDKDSQRVLYEPDLKEKQLFQQLKQYSLPQKNQPKNTIAR